jgi:SAM-dependent methyltransferase
MADQETPVFPAMECPVCRNTEINPALTVRDHSVSGEIFEVVECTRCRLRFTAGAPGDGEISGYYQSENYISHSNTRKGMINWLYHRVRNITLAGKYRLLKKATQKEKGKHLDIGAGTGAFVHYLRSKGWESTGIEPDDTARERARLHHRTHLLPAAALDTMEPGSFDAITLWHVLEHVHALYPYLHRIKSLLRPGGLLFIAVPNYMSDDARRYGAFWAAYDVPRHLYHFCPDAMLWLLNQSGFQFRQMIPMWWDSYYISLLSEKYKGSSVAALKGLVRGSLSNWKAIGNTAKCSSVIYIAGQEG